MRTLSPRQKICKNNCVLGMWKSVINLHNAKVLILNTIKCISVFLFFSLRKCAHPTAEEYYETDVTAFLIQPHQQEKARRYGRKQRQFIKNAVNAWEKSAYPELGARMNLRKLSIKELPLPSAHAAGCSACRLDVLL